MTPTSIFHLNLNLEEERDVTAQEQRKMYRVVQIETTLAEMKSRISTVTLGVIKEMPR